MSRAWRLLVVAVMSIPVVIPRIAPVAAAASAWTQEATSIPTPRNSLTVTTGQDGWIYTFGGFAAGGGDYPGYRSDVEAYNPATGVWRCSVGDTAPSCSSSLIAPLPGGGRYLFTAVTGADGTLYVLGGQTYTSDLATVQAYNPAANTWTTKASMRMARSRLGATVGLDGKIYVAGSYYGSNTFEVYDPALDTWTYKANMLEGRNDPLVATGPDGKIYVIGGSRTGAAGEDTIVQIYDPTTNSWNYGATAPFGRYVAGAVSATGGIYATGGAYSDTRVAMYAPNLNQWIVKASLPTALPGHVTVLGPDNRLYAIGGNTLSDGALAGLPAIYAYAPAPYAQLTAPASAGANVPFSVTVTIRNDAGNVDTSYRGTLSFSSSDAGATLPGNYTFTAGDNGVRTFSGVKLAASGGRSITVTDITNSEITATASITVDGVAPTTTISGNGYSFGNWTNGNVTVSLSATDNPGGSGVDKTYYNLDNAGQQTYAGQITVSAEGTHTLLYWSTDTAGNVEMQRAAAIKIDKTAPVVSCGGADTLWHGANVTFQCTSADGGSGLANNAFASFSLTTAVAAGAETSAAASSSATVCDQAGNCSAAGPITGNMVDRKAPTVNASARTADNNAYTSGTWTRQDVTVSFVCLDGGSGVASCSPPATIDTPGFNQSRGGSGTDAVGNTANATFSGINIDRTAPVTTLDAGAYVPGSWTNAAVRVTLSAADTTPGADVAGISYMLDGGAPQTYAAPGVDVSAEGVHTLTYWSADSAGNVETSRSVQIQIDMTNPTFSCEQPDGAWHAADVSLACTASDALSTLRNPADASFTLSTSLANGSETSDAATASRVICDLAGNCLTAGPIGGNRIDKLAPRFTCGSADGVWHATDVRIGCVATDGGAGLWSASDGAFDLTTSVPAGAETNNAATDSRQVCDLVGNCAIAGPLGGFQVDKLAPQLSCGAADGAWHADNVAIACTSVDGGSGLAYSADAAFDLTTNVPDGIETNNADTDSRAVCDGVGNCATAGPLGGNKIDRADPTITIATPQDGAIYQRKQPLTADFSCADGGAGVASCVGSVADGAALDTVTPGPHTVTVTARDVVGNVASATVGYSIEGNMHVAALAGYRAQCDGQLTGCLAFGAKIEAQRDGVAGAIVAARISKPGGVSETLSATTDRLGNASFLTRNIGPGTYTLTVLNVTVDYFHYAPAENVVTSRGLVVGAR